MGNSKIECSVCNASTPGAYFQQESGGYLCDKCMVDSHNKFYGAVKQAQEKVDGLMTWLHSAEGAETPMKAVDLIHELYGLLKETTKTGEDKKIEEDEERCCW